MSYGLQFTDAAWGRNELKVGTRNRRLRIEAEVPPNEGTRREFVSLELEPDEAEQLVDFISEYLNGLNGGQPESEAA